MTGLSSYPWVFSSMLATYVELIICCDPLFRVAPFPHDVPMELLIFLIRMTLTSKFPTCPHHHLFLLIVIPVTAVCYWHRKHWLFPSLMIFKCSFYDAGWTRINPEIHNGSTALKVRLPDHRGPLGPLQALVSWPSRGWGNVIFVSERSVKRLQLIYKSS